MVFKELVIKIEDNRIYYRKDKYVKLFDSTFRDFFGEKIALIRPIYLLTRFELTEGYDKRLKALRLEIIEYDTQNTNLLESSEEKTVMLSYIAFPNFDINKFIEFIDVSENHTRRIKEDAEKNFEKNYEKHKQETASQKQLSEQTLPPELVDTYKKIPKEEFKEIDFQMNLLKCTFHNGYIDMKKRIDEMNLTLNFRIYNSNILQDFDYIKGFFVKSLDLTNQNINVKAKLLFIDSRFSKIISSHSEEIKKINSSIIDVAKWLYIRDTIKKHQINSQKIVLDTKDIFKPEDNNVNFMPPSASELINNVEKFNVRNMLQLKYLATKLQNPNYQLKFTAKTNKYSFGFLFFVTAGEKMFHFIWELLDSNATYIWSYPKEDNSQTYINTLYQRMENTLSHIFTYGRKKYILDFNNNLIDADVAFDRIVHENINSQIEHFPLWKTSLNKRLI